MSARAKKPTTRPPVPARAKRGTMRGHDSGPIPTQKPPSDYGEIDPTRLGYDSVTTPSDDQRTNIYDSTERRRKQAAAPEHEAPKPIDRSGPIQVISMKTPGVGSGPAPIERPKPQVKLRAISEVTNRERVKPADLGNIAPPRDPREVRSRRTNETVMWASIAVILAAAVALSVWFLAR